MTQTPSTPKDVLELAMRREKEGHEFYLKAAAGTSNAKGKHMFEWLAQEETKHYQKLESELQALSRTGQWRPPGRGPLTRPRSLSSGPSSLPCRR